MPKVQVFNCYFHYNKLFPERGQLNKMLVYFGDQTYSAPAGMECQVPTFSVERAEQPKIVMACMARKVWYNRVGLLVIE